MSKKDIANKLPVPQSSGRREPALFTPAPRATGGVADSWLTGWEAKRKTVAHKHLAVLSRAKADELDAYGELAESYRRTARIVAQLDELPDDIALDRAKRQAEREQQYDDIESEKEERRAERQERIAKKNTAALKAKHGLEAANHFKDYQFKLGEHRARGRITRTRYENEPYERALSGEKEPEPEQNDQPSRRQRRIADLLADKENALADGDYEEAGRCEAALQALGVGGE